MGMSLISNAAGRLEEFVEIFAAEKNVRVTLVFTSALEVAFENAKLDELSHTYCHHRRPL
jgi:hypothetical protein